MPGDTDKNSVPDTDPDNDLYNQFNKIVQFADPIRDADKIKRAKIRMQEIETKWKGKQPQQGA